MGKNPIQMVTDSLGINMSSEEKANAKTEELRKKAMKYAVQDYNIERIDNVDYITYFGVPVSIPEDAKTSSMCDRLEVYRENYVNACLAAKTTLNHDSR